MSTYMCAYLCVCVPVYVCESVYRCVAVSHECKLKPEGNTGVLLYLSPLHALNTESLTELETQSAGAGLAGQTALVSLLSLPLMCLLLQVCQSPHLAFTWVLVGQTQVACLFSKH